MSDVIKEDQLHIPTMIYNAVMYMDTTRLANVFSRFELYQCITHVPGDIIECGVGWGGGLMLFSKLMTLLEPHNITRRIWGFDTFDTTDRFPGVHPYDGRVYKDIFHDEFDNEEFPVSKQHLQEAIDHYTETITGKVQRTFLVEGDAQQTIPLWADTHKNRLIALLYLDFDIYTPTKVALDTFKSRMPRGAIIAFDELQSDRWPGESLALQEVFNVSEHHIERLEWDNGLLSFITL